MKVNELVHKTGQYLNIYMSLNLHYLLFMNKYMLTSQYCTMIMQKLWCTDIKLQLFVQSQCHNYDFWHRHHTKLHCYKM